MTQYPNSGPPSLVNACMICMTPVHADSAAKMCRGHWGQIPLSIKREFYVRAGKSSVYGANRWLQLQLSILVPRLGSPFNETDD